MQKLKNKKCSVIIQARLNSTRYKSKILKKINNLTILEILIRRLKKSKKINKIIIAFPMNNIDDKLVNVCKKLNILFYRGPELNVLKRYYLAAKKFKLKDIARITSDCPLIDVSVFDKLVDKYFSSKFDYASNVVNPTYPDGMDIEIFNFKTLKDQYLNHSNKINNEHVTTGMMANKNYKICSLTLKKDYSNLKLSLDTPYDLKILSKVIKKFKNNIYIKLENILNLYDQDPNFFEKNMNYFSKRTVIDIYDWSENTIHNAYVYTYQCGKRIFEKKYDNHNQAIKDFPNAEIFYDSANSGRLESKYA